MKTVSEFLQERKALVLKAQEVIKGADGRELTAEERSKYDAIMVDVDKIKEQADAILADEKRKANLDSALVDLDKPIDKRIMPKIDDKKPIDKRSTPEYAKAYNEYLGSTNQGEQARALQMDLDTSGGYTVPPQQYVAELIEALKANTVMRGISRTFSVPGAQSLGAPALDNRPANPTWTSELLIGDEDSTMSFGKRELTPKPLAQYIKVSKKLVRASALNIGSIVRDQLAYLAGTVEDNAFLNGSGANQPLGVFTASANGIDTDRDVSTGNTDTEIRADGLIEAKYDLRSVYWPNARWIFHQNAIKQIRKLRGNDGDFLWQPGLAGDRGDMVLSVPILASEYAPHTFTTGLYVGIIGDFRYYWIADALDTIIEVLTELFAATNQNGYVLRKETDGMPVLSEAFRRVTLA